jgi:hypothetical protein
MGVIQIHLRTNTLKTISKMPKIEDYFNEYEVRIWRSKNELKTVIIDSDRQKTYAINLIQQMPIDGSFEVITKKVDLSSTAKQRGLKWRWNDDILKSGLGNFGTAMDVHIYNKKEFGHPILMRDDKNYPPLFRGFRDNVKQLDDYIERMKWFVSNKLETEGFTRSQQAEYLTYVQQYWVSKGVNLCDPNDYGKNLLRFKPNKQEA